MCVWTIYLSIYLVAPMMDGWMDVKASPKEGETMLSDW
jgi:hypothetical protein